MAQLQRMDAHLDTLSMELYQVNVRVVVLHDGRRLWAALHLSLLLHHLIASDSDGEDDDGDDDNASDDNGDASSTDEMST